MPNGRHSALSRWIWRPWKRIRARERLIVHAIHRVHRPLRFALLLAVAGLSLFTPLLLDDLVFHASQLTHLSPDAVTISEPTMISDQPMVTLASGTLSVPPSRSGQARTGEALAALIKGGGARLVLTTPFFELEVAPHSVEDNEEIGATPPELAALSPLLAALLDASFETLTIRDGTVMLKSVGGRVEVFSQISAEVSVKRKTAIRFKGSASLRGQVLTFDATFGARIGRRSNAKMPVRAQIKSGLFSVAIDGRLDVGQGIALMPSSVDISVANVRSVARWFDHIWASGPGWKNFNARGIAEWSGHSIIFNKGTFQMDGNEATGALSLSIGGTRPSFSGTLALQEADLTPYVTDQTAPATSPAGSLIALLKTTRDSTLSLMGALDADLRLSAETVAIGSFQVGRSALSLAMHDGDLLLDLADLSLPGGGVASGTLGIGGTRTAPDYVIHGRLEGAEFSELTSVIDGIPLVRGVGNMNFDLKASGGAGIDLLSRLTGQVNVQMPNGGIAACALKDLTSLPANACRATTALTPFQAMLSMTNGVVGADHVEAITGSDRVRIDGTIDLVTSIMDLKISTASLGARPGPAVEGEPVAGFITHDTFVVRGRPENPSVFVISP